MYHLVRTTYRSKYAIPVGTYVIWNNLFILLPLASSRIYLLFTRRQGPVLPYYWARQQLHAGWFIHLKVIGAPQGLKVRTITHLFNIPPKLRKTGCGQIALLLSTGTGSQIHRRKWRGIDSKKSWCGLCLFLYPISLYVLLYLICRRGYAFSQEEGGAVSQTQYIRSYDTTIRFAFLFNVLHHCTLSGSG
jgi:hypothetical protein